MKIILPLLAIVSLFLPFLAQANAFALVFSPVEDTYSAGDTFVVEILVDTQNQDVNAVAAYVDYPSDLLSVVSMDMKDAPFMFIVEQNYGAGKIAISGGTPTPGFNGVYRVATIEFQAIEPGDATLSFTGDSAVLLDSDNTNILQGQPQATVRIANANIGTAPSVQAETPQYRSPLETLLAFLKGLL
ncbi:MAG TPA: cohesin domain-containing protein [Candidatus Paceibacterota bacterium]|nr:cohesin domain-containing protein [Candidatus Paceibacterota bacterium]